MTANEKGRFCKPPFVFFRVLVGPVGLEPTTKRL
jgi:hypothetical protein